VRTLRNIFRRKLRASLTIFGIAIGVLALVVMGSIAEKLQLLVDGGVRYYGDKVVVVGKSVGFSSPPIQVDVIREIERIDGVAKASASAGALLDTEVGSVNFGPPASIYGEDGRGDPYESFKVAYAEGRGPRAGESKVAAVGADLVSSLDAAVGGTVEIRDEDYRVVGILDHGRRHA
jgi:putative ABC transport system permease protein